MAKMVKAEKDTMNHDPKTVKELNIYLRYMALTLIECPEKKHRILENNYYHVESMISRHEFFSLVLAKVNSFMADVVFEDADAYLKQLEEEEDEE